jgi:excisionase family DNA binding protein
MKGLFTMSNESDNKNELLTVDEVSKIFRVDPTTVRRWVKHGSLHAITLPHKNKRQAYRIKRATVERLLAGTAAA